MSRKMFETRGRFGLVFKILRLLHGLGKGDFNASSYTDADDPRQLNSFNPQVHMLAKRRMHEVETQKAMITSEMRHERWKAGGPI